MEVSLPMTQEDAADKPLTARQEQFCREYAVDMNATGAARRAGYSEATAEQQGSRLLRNVKVARRIAELTEVKAERAALDAQTVLEGLLMEARGEGPDTNSASRTGAWRLIGQHLGMWKEKDTGKDRPVNVNFNFQPLTPEEIAAEKARRAQDD